MEEHEDPEIVADIHPGGNTVEPETSPVTVEPPTAAETQREATPETAPLTTPPENEESDLSEPTTSGSSTSSSSADTVVTATPVRQPKSDADYTPSDCSHSF